MMSRFFLAAALLALCTALQAQTPQSTSGPNGVAPYVELDREAFLMGLYVPGMATTAQAALSATGSRALELKFTAERMTAGKLSRLFLQSIAINAHPDAQRASADSLASFFNAFKGSLRPGDVLTISEKTDASGVLVYLNGHTLVSITDSNFFNVLLVAWIGAVPPSTDFKAALLGEYEATDLVRFQQITPTQTRRADIAAWLEPAEPQAAAEAQAGGAATEAVAQGEQAPAPLNDEGEPEAAAAPDAPAEAQAPQTAAIASVADELPATATAASETDATVTEQDKTATAVEEAAADTNEPAPAIEPPAPAVAERIEDEEEEDLPDFSAASLQTLQDYTALLVRLTHEQIKYPRRAMKLRQTGSVRMAVVIDAAGELKEMRPLLESDFKQLNDAVERAVEDAAPYPPLPAELSAEHFEFVFPITFMLES